VLKESSPSYEGRVGERSERLTHKRKPYDSTPNHQTSRTPSREKSKISFFARCPFFAASPDSRTSRLRVGMKPGPEPYVYRCLCNYLRCFHPRVPAPGVRDNSRLLISRTRPLGVEYLMRSSLPPTRTNSAPVPAPISTKLFNQRSLSPTKTAACYPAKLHYRFPLALSRSSAILSQHHHRLK
jgi:hypothetical protein